MKIAVIGAGISGLGAAWMLDRRYQVTVYESAPRLGGHANTVEVAWPERDRRVAVDTGFIVYNEPNYPNLTALFDHLEVPTAPSDMSFGVSLDGGRLEYSGDSLWTMIGQPSNALSPRHWGMIRDALRFFREAPAVLHDPAAAHMTLSEFLSDARLGAAFRDDHLLPMAAAIWSCSSEQIARFPIRSFVRFFHNHGLLSVADRPQWRTVLGGSREYVRRLSMPFADRVRLDSPIAAIRRLGGQVEVRDRDGNRALYDHVVLAAHADQAIRLLDDADAREREVLGAFSYQPNRAVLHSDPALMPRRRRLWASWNYLGEAAQGGPDRRVSVTYWMNRLQGLDPAFPLFVSMNPIREPDPAKVHGEFAYAHPLYDLRTMAAQAELEDIQGCRNTWFCGAWTGYGFHEDGLASAVRVATALGAAPPWTGEGRGQPRLALEPMAAAPEVVP